MRKLFIFFNETLYEGEKIFWLKSEYILLNLFVVLLVIALSLVFFSLADFFIFSILNTIIF
jgi:preprotein translocase subunit SecE